MLTPTAYNNGEALCIKPDDGSGDFQFSRNSAATRVNAQGLVENVQILSSNLVQNGDFSEEGSEEVSNGSFSQEGSELVTNGDFATDTDWTKQTSWSISGGSANYDFLSDSKYIRQTLLNGGFVAGKTYKINFEITSGTAYMNVNSNGGGLISLNTYSVGSYSIYVTPSISASDLLFYGRNTSGTAFSIDNVSVREVGQDWTLGTGWSIAEDKAISDGTSGNNVLQQTIFSGSELGNYFKVQYEITSYTSGTLLLRATGFHGAIAIDNSVGVHTLYLEATSTSTDLVFVTEAAGFNGSITNISVKEVGQNWDLGTGWSIGNGVAIFDYDTSISKIFTSNLNLNLNNSYKLSFEIKNVLSGTPNIFIANSGGSVGYNGNYTNYSEGVHTLIFSPSSNQTTLSFFARYSDFSITNISVIEITDDTNLPRINYEGFSYQDALGSELVTNGGFNDGTNNWTQQLNVNFSVDNGVATIQSTGNNSLIYQYISPSTNSALLKIEFDVVSFSGSYFYISLGGYSTQITQTGKVVIYTTSNRNSNKFDIAPQPTTTIKLNNVSVKEYLGQEVVPDSGCGSWLFEPQSTNLVTQSELFSGGFWGNYNSTITNNQTTAPDGLLTASKFSGTSDVTAHTLYLNATQLFLEMIILIVYLLKKMKITLFK